MVRRTDQTLHVNVNKNDMLVLIGRSTASTNHTANQGRDCSAAEHILVTLGPIRVGFPDIREGLDVYVR